MRISAVDGGADGGATLGATEPAGVAEGATCEERGGADWLRAAAVARGDGGVAGEHAAMAIALTTRTTLNERVSGIELLLIGMCSLKTRQDLFCDLAVGTATGDRGDACWSAEATRIWVQAGRDRLSLSAKILGAMGLRPETSSARRRRSVFGTVERRLHAAR